MTIQFKTITKETSFLDPTKGFELTRVRFEIRFDPLTNKTGRIVNVDNPRVHHPDLEGIVKKSLEIGCPFCEESLDQKTGRFPADIIPDGRIQRGKATVIPNIAPYDTFAAVCLFSNDHFIPLEGFGPEILTNAFLACQDFFRQVSSRKPDVAYFSINWNYMPPAGSSLVHPHLQPIAGETPTNTHRELISASHEYVTHYVTHYWRDLVEREEELGERYLGKTGRITWVAPFVPTGLFPDMMAVFWECGDILDLADQDFSDFSDGLVKVFRYFHSLGIYSLNFSLFSGPKNESTVWVHSKITPRSFPRPIGNSDVTYFGMLHREPISIMKPEEMVSRLKPQFSP